MHGRKTADICDKLPAGAQVGTACLFKSYGGVSLFEGEVATVKVYEDNVLVRAALETPGRGRVLVVDGGGSLRCALAGDRLARVARDNDWSGLLIYGCVRDTRELKDIELGVLAIGAHPIRPGKGGHGQTDVPVEFLGLRFEPGAHVYADDDGVVITPRSL